MFLIGSHLSTAGTLSLAPMQAKKLGIHAIQIFAKNANQWVGKKLVEPDCQNFLDECDRSNIASAISHTSYLINLGSPRQDLWEKSCAALLDELLRGHALNLQGAVLHPGAATDGDRESALARVARGIDSVFSQLESTLPQSSTKLYLENTAGQGSALGWKLAELARIIEQLDFANRVAICIDTCHSFAAGYDLSTDEGLDVLVEELSQYDLLDRVLAIHLNDSKKACGSRVDRHEHLGVGLITLDGIARFINHPAFERLPMILETEKGLNEDSVDWDQINIEVARKLRNENRDG